MSTGAIVIFSGLKMKTYAVVVDMSDILNDKMDKKVWGMSTNLGNELNKNGGELDFEIDIWPYDPWDIEK